MAQVQKFSQEIAFELFNSAEEFPINFDDAWQWLEYDTKGNGKRYLIANLEKSVDFIKNEELGSLAVPRPSEKILLSIEGFKNWAMMSKTEVGKQVRKYFIQCEKIAKEKAIAVKPLSGIEMARENLRLWEELEAKQALITSQETKIIQLDSEVGVLTEVVDQLFDYSSIIRVAKHNNVNPGCFAWHKLKAASKTLNLEIKSAPCDIWGTKNLYPSQAWQFVYPEYRLPEASSLVLG